MSCFAGDGAIDVMLSASKDVNDCHPLASCVMNYSTVQSLRQLRGYHIINATVPHYLPNFKSPCWLTETELNQPQLHCLPYFFMAGFPKCGTTDIYAKLEAHPQMLTGQKELHWWTRHLFEKNDNILGYTKLFAKRREAMLENCTLDEPCNFVIGK